MHRMSAAAYQRAPYRLMGIVNVTPDSFSDGGLFIDARAAISHAHGLVEEGADIVDVGGESTRPGAEPVSVDEELRRVLPVVEGIAASGAAGSVAAEPGIAASGVAGIAGSGGVRISIDTSKASVARAALDAGASIVNDVSALRADPEMAGLVAQRGCDCCLMHMLGEPRTMQSDPRYGDVVDDVCAFLAERMAYAVREGVREERIMLDPGIGFGKTVAQNLALLRRLEELVSLGRPVLVGTSRKSFLGRIIADAAGEPEPVSAARRLGGTIATNLLAYERGASVFRVHEVAPVRAALAVAAATLS
jgi:dihydropteroate synthase